MGFYDEFDNKPKKGRSPIQWVAVVVVSALVGSGATLLTVPALMKSNVFSEPVKSAISGATNSENVQVNVSSGIVQAVNKVKPAVVGVLNLQNQSDWTGKTSEQTSGTGSGILIDNQGHIVTNNHVVEGAVDVEVVIQDMHIKAKVLGTDKVTDLAVIQVPADKVKDIQPAQLGDSDALQIGEPAIAIGNPLGLKFAQSVTTGVISSTKRELPVNDENGQTVYEQAFLQTDAAINPGNSGGALVNIQGQVIGINSAKISSQGVEGLGFSIPINEAKPIINQLMAKGKVIRPALGIGVRAIEEIPETYRVNIPVDKGLFVVQSSGAAKAAGIQKGDIVVKIDDKDTVNFVDLRKYLFTKQPGDTVKVTYYHDKEQKTANVKLGTLDQ